LKSDAGRLTLGAKAATYRFHALPLSFPFRFGIFRSHAPRGNARPPQQGKRARNWPSRATPALLQGLLLLEPMQKLRCIHQMHDRDYEDGKTGL